MPMEKRARGMSCVLAVGWDGGRVPSKEESGERERERRRKRARAVI